MFKFFITSLILIFITYYYLAKKKDLIFKANFIYIFYNFCDSFFLESNLYSRFFIFAFLYLLSILYL